ncbi:hypothetical protein DEJ03_07890 [Curtobacterium sp. MCLR17_043]|uniref:hypothetical protein n=1 Tax=Curtobacterium sp. MCLR17_043 TaxID=2175627 RepID=UPI000D88C3B6|nr:hypothetical protein [Curtobacterium sp. MCLR17_043]PYY46395.1 hypothetical protein DEJ03_07890 [Curtobacterium sp. MCLR17_043]
MIVGQSAEFPVPGSGPVSMEQAAVLMMQRVLAAESPDERVHALVLGPVRTRFVDGEPDWVAASEVGAAAVALSLATGIGSHSVSLASSAEARAATEAFRAAA